MFNVVEDGLVMGEVLATTGVVKNLGDENKGSAISSDYQSIKSNRPLALLKARHYLQENYDDIENLRYSQRTKRLERCPEICILI